MTRSEEPPPRSPDEPDLAAVGDFRALTADEDAMLSLLLSQPFPGREALTAQHTSIRGRAVDVDGSLALRSTTGPRAEVVRRVPVEAEGVDREAQPVYVLLHVVEGRMVELEIYRTDGKVPVGELGELELSILESGGWPPVS